MLQHVVVGDEHDDEIHRFAFAGDVLVVFLFAEFVDVAAHAFHMAFQCRPAFLLVPGIGKVGIGLEAHLRVDDDVPSFGEVYDGVRNEFLSRLVVCDGFSGLVAYEILFLKLLAFGESHVFEECFQADFPKVSLRLVFVRQGVCQFVGTGLHVVGMLQGGAYGAVEGRHLLYLFRAGFLHLFAHVSQVVVQGVEDVLEFLAVVAELFVVVLLQLFAALFQNPLRGGEHLAFQHFHLLAVMLFLLLCRFLGTFFVVLLQRIQHCGMFCLGRFHPLFIVGPGTLQVFHCLAFSVFQHFCGFAFGAFQRFLRLLLLLRHPLLHVGCVFLGVFQRHIALFLRCCQCRFQLCRLFHGQVFGHGASFDVAFLACFFAGLLLFAPCLRVPHCESCHGADEEGGDGDENFCHHMGV